MHARHWSLSVVSGIIEQAIFCCQLAIGERTFLMVLDPPLSSSFPIHLNMPSPSNFINIGEWPVEHATYRSQHTTHHSPYTHNTNLVCASTLSRKTFYY